MNKMMQEEFDGLIADKRNSEEILNNELVKFADEIKNGLGDEIKQELLNPTNHTVKKSKKEKRKEMWRNFKLKLNQYFFSENNDFDILNDD